MGNNSSKTGNTPQSANASLPSLDNDSTVTPSKPLRERESTQVLSTAKTSAAPPSASPESATAAPTSKSRAPSAHSLSSRNTSTTVVICQQSTEGEGIDMGRRRVADMIGAGSLTLSRSRSPVKPAAPAAVDPLLSLPVSPSNPTTGNYYLPSQWARPPRLPLPIEEEVFSPGSPIISPTNLASHLENPENDSILSRKESVLSSTTVDEDDLGEEYQAADAVNKGPTVERLIEWRHGVTNGGVYVTGTFCGWDKKIRLHKNGLSKTPNAFSAMIPFPAGTHHVAFLVDGDMKSASHMPTAVDFTNKLVNWVEIDSDDVRPTTQPRDIPRHVNPGHFERRVPPGYHPPQVLPPLSPELKPTTTAPSQSAPGTPTSTSGTRSSQLRPAVALTKKLTTKKHHSDIPRFLMDLDGPEDSGRFQRASAVMGTQPAPPSLPMFLNKSIINGATPLKDDSSVLIIPNHTVLNHLATSSIKNNVLATSATTRYKRKASQHCPFALLDIRQR